jgi:uncharacterized membrane protein YcaP (DUF421 family)
MTLTELQTRRAAYAAAELKILESQDYTVGDGVTNRRNRRADLEQVRIAIAEIDGQIAALETSLSGVRRVLYLR